MTIFFCGCFLKQPFSLTKSSTGLGADGKDASCFIEEARVDPRDGAFVKTLPTQGEKKMEHGNSSASGSGASERVMLFITGLRFHLDSSLEEEKT